MQVSIEADPGTFDAARLREYMDLGINRVSMGVQSFDEVCVLRCVASSVHAMHFHAFVV